MFHDVTERVKVMADAMYGLRKVEGSRRRDGG
jgi:hypothetical protein